MQRVSNAKVFSKFDMKSEFWQIQISEKDKYKTAFNVPFGQYEWNVMPFGLTNAPSEFQKIMNDIFNPFQLFMLTMFLFFLKTSINISSIFEHFLRQSKEVV